MDGDRRTCLEGRARFPLYKAHVASTLPNVERLMPKPWFEELVCEMARVRIRCEHRLAAAPQADAPPAQADAPAVQAGSWRPAAGSFASTEAPSPTSAAGTA